MLRSKWKSSIFLAAMVSIPLQAQDNDVEDTLAEQTLSKAMKIKASEPETRSATCPDDFFTLPLYPNAKFCQLFADEQPASMSYFAVSDQQTTKAFYLEQLGQAEDEKILKGRIVLQYANGQKVVVISKDGQGSQIDILIKSAG